MIGYVFKFNGHGAFAPDGKVEMSDDEIKAHNADLARVEVEFMKANGRIALYRHRNEHGQFVGTWEGSFKWAVSYSRTGRHNMAGERWDCWFTGPDGAKWHGVNIRDNDIVRCKRLKGGAS